MDWQKIYLSRAIRYTRILSLIPFVRFVGLNGSLARGCSSKKSDIDLLIVTHPGRIYTVRLFATIILALTPWRRRPNNVAGKICLNCFLSENHLNICPECKSNEKKVALSNLALVPLFDLGNVYEKFQHENVWMKNYLIEKKKKNFPIRSLKNKKFLQTIKEKICFTSLGDWFEHWQMNYQTTRILRGKKQVDEIYVSTDFIKLHPKK
jgi:predicted nucleotidyltransferase